MSAMQQLLMTGKGFSATVSPASITETKAGVNGSTLISLSTATATPVGGSGTYTYSWALSIQIGNATLVITSPTASVTTFKIPASVSGDVGEADAICTVTDTVTTLTAATIACHVQFTHS